MADGIQVIWIEEVLDELGYRYTYEFEFCKSREWRFDLYVKDLSLGIEFNGKQFSKGGHTSGIGYGKDIFKINAAVLLGFRVVQFTTEHSKEYMRAVLETVGTNTESNNPVFSYGLGTNTKKRNRLIDGEIAKTKNGKMRRKRNKPK